VDVVGDAADGEGATIVLLREAAQVAVEFWEDVRCHEGFAIFGGENDVEVNAGEGLGHGAMVGKGVEILNWEIKRARIVEGLSESVQGFI
jgi:hypothetical protein